MKRHLAMISLFLTVLFIFSGCGKGISDGALFDNAKAMVAEVKSGITEITYEDFSFGDKVFIIIPLTFVANEGMGLNLH